MLPPLPLHSATPSLVDLAHRIKAQTSFPSSNASTSNIAPQTTPQPGVAAPPFEGAGRQGLRPPTSLLELSTEQRHPAQAGTLCSRRRPTRSRRRARCHPSAPAHDFFLPARSAYPEAFGCGDGLLYFTGVDERDSWSACSETPYHPSGWQRRPVLPGPAPPFPVNPARCHAALVVSLSRGCMFFGNYAVFRPNFDSIPRVEHVLHRRSTCGRDVSSIPTDFTIDISIKAVEFEICLRGSLY